MNLDRAIDNLPENEFAYLLNIRSYEDGTVNVRPGTVLVSQFPSTGGGDFVHSLYTLNDVNPDSVGASRRFTGYNQSVYFSDITFPATPTFIDAGFSGNPLSMIGMSPLDNPAPFLYVYDSVKQEKFSASYVTAGVPRVYPIGVDQITVYKALAPVPTFSGTGNISGNGYSWRWQLRHVPTGAKSIPGVPTYTPQNLTTDSASFPDPALIITGNPTIDGEYTWDLYRFGGAIQAWAFIGSVQNGSGLTIVDNFTDLSILSAPTLPVDDRSILFQPWLTPDTPSSGVTVFTQAAVATSSGVTGGHGSLIRSNGFNPDWIPGTEIVVGDRALTIAAIISPQTLYVTEDLGGDLGVVGWKVTGALKAGSSLPYVFGPYGAGQFGLYLFGVGDPHAPGTVYWTNGNDPDSTSFPNSLDICGPSEVLQNGCIWNGRVWIWSTERMWELVPDLVNQGQFLAQAVPGARGLPNPWCFCVGDLIYFKSKDGIFRFAGGLPEPISDHQLYELLGHDGQNGTGRSLFNPEDPDNPLTVQPPDPNLPAQQRLCYYDGVLYFDYVDTEGKATTLLYDTHIIHGWVKDDYGLALSGYRAHFAEIGFHDLLMGCGARLAWMTGNTEYSGTINQVPIELAMMTSADILGDIRGTNLIGDAIVGAAPGTQPFPINARILGERNTTVLASGTLAPSGSYQQTIITVNNAVLNLGEAAFSQSVGLWLHGFTDAPAIFYDWEPSWVDKPETITKRATDWTDDGLKGAKYLKAIVIEAAISTIVRAFDLVIDHTDPQRVSSPTYFFSAVDNRRVIVVTSSVNGFIPGQYTILTASAGLATLDHAPGPVDANGGIFSLTGSRQVSIQTDGGITAAHITLAATQQSEFAYSILPPIVAKMMRLVPLDEEQCQIFSVRWIWDPYPEYLDIKEDFYREKWPTTKYVRGVRLEGDSQGSVVHLSVQKDGGAVVTTLAIQQNEKDLTVIGFGTPFLAKELRIVPLDNWRKHAIEWIVDDYPDFAALITPWEDCGRVGDKYLRGGVLVLDTGGVPRTLTLQSPEFPDIKQVIANVDGKTAIPFDMPFPPTIHLLRWVPDGPWMYWQTEWHFDPYSEFSREFSPIMDLGYKGPKFMQGIRFVGDSQNNDAVFQIVYDGFQLGYTSPAAKWNGKETLPFSFPVPFIAHNLQIQPQQNLRTFDDEIEWIWEPAPDLAQNWITQPTDHDIPGYHHVRDGWIAYQSAAGAIVPETLTIETEYGVFNTALPVSTNYTRVYVTLPNMKARWRTYKLTSVLGARLFVKDTAFRIKPWGASGPYMPVMPFGDISRQIGARI